MSSCRGIDFSVRTFAVMSSPTRPSPAGRRHGEDPVLVGQGARDAVDLELADERRSRAGEPPVDACAPRPELVLGERVVQREHRGAVRDRAEQLGRRGADALGRRVRRDELGEPSSSARSSPISSSYSASETSGSSSTW